MTETQSGKLFSFYYRLDVLGMKVRGILPQFSWGDVASMMKSSSIHWPAEKLVTQKQLAGEISLYDTPIGPVAHGANANEAKILGLLVLEELRGTYEHGGVGVQTGDVVIDLGANVGSFTRFALSKGAAKVVAFEPEPRHIAILKLGFAKEIQEGRVVLIEAAAGAEKTTLRFQSAGLVSRFDEAGEITVPVFKIDTVVEELGLKRVDFIKADIEGAERDALKGAEQTIKKFGPRMALCIYHLPDDPAVITSTVQGFRPYNVAKNLSGSQAFFQVPSSR
jgi:FkbM family methyltransferase